MHVSYLRAWQLQHNYQCWSSWSSVLGGSKIYIMHTWSPLESSQSGAAVIMLSSFSSSARMCVNNLIWRWGWRSCIVVVSGSDIVSEMPSHRNESQNLIDLLWVELSLGGIPFSKCCEVLRSLPWDSCSASRALVSESGINNFITVVTIISIVGRSASMFVGTGMHPIGRRRVNRRWWLIYGSANIKRAVARMLWYHENIYLNYSS